MFKINFLRNLFLLTLVLAAGFPLYNFYYTYPAYTDLLIQETESEASRFVRYLVVSNGLEKIELDSAFINPEIIADIMRLKDDPVLKKLRIFNSSGRIVFSTQADEIGRLNRNEYFTQIVARGQIYSKVVRKDRKTAEGFVSVYDVVETYVPIMVADQFHGAVEVYSDITVGQEHLHEINMTAGAHLFLFSSAFVILMGLGLKRAKVSFVALSQAENALQVANENLENRVVKRTEQLLQANDKLNAEIVVRQQAEDDLKDALLNVSDARDKIDTILSSVADALIVIDNTGCVMHMNHVAQRYFKLDSWIVGMPFSHMIKLPDLLDNIATAKDCLVEEEIAEFDVRLPEDENGVQKILAARATLLLSGQGAQRGMVIFLQDATKARNIERMKSEFVSIAAHELRTPLTMILGYSDLMLEERSFPEKEKIEFLSVINSKALHLSAIVDDLLDVSRIENGRPLELYSETVNFSMLLGRSVAEAEMHDNGFHTFVVSMPKEHCYVTVDPGRIQQVLENILNNAVKYSPDGGEILVQLVQGVDFLEFKIVDQGVGMTENQMSRAFDRFYRADTSDTGIRGTGLGLSIVKYIVDAHKGEVTMKSQFGEGTEVSVRLPNDTA